MKELLANILVEKKYLKEDMEITAKYKSYDLSHNYMITVIGDFFIHAIKNCENNNLVFNLVSTKDGFKKTILSENIIKIEGMEPERYAKIYNIKPDGAQCSAKKKRGRKTNAEKELLKLRAIQ